MQHVWQKAAYPRGLVLFAEFFKTLLNFLAPASKTAELCRNGFLLRQFGRLVQDPELSAPFLQRA
jgi:hypothetical protein